MPAAIEFYTWIAIAPRHDRKLLAELSQLRVIFGNFAIIFVVKSCASIAEL
jgi:hypothetical protein